MSTTETPLLSPEFLARLEQLELVSRKVFRGRMKGERRSKRKGQSVEFADFRNYVVGDDIRFIDWNTYARLDKLFLKLYLEEEDLHFYTLLDTSMSMEFGDPTKLWYAKQVAAALGFIGLTHSDRVVIETIGQAPQQLGAVLRGRGSMWRMLDHLQRIEASGGTSLATVVCAGDWVRMGEREFGAKGLCQERAYVCGLEAANSLLRRGIVQGHGEHRVIPIRPDEPQVLLGRALNKLVMDPLEAVGLRWPWFAGEGV